MPRGKSSQDSSMLEMALVGYEIEKKKIEEKIREIRTQLGGGRSTENVRGPSTNNEPPKRRKLSVAARKRIAAAQKKRWAEHRRATAQASKGE
jgi:hypothetical protein